MVLNSNAVQGLPDGNIATELNSRQNVFKLGENGKMGFIEAGQMTKGNNGENVLKVFATIRGSEPIGDSIPTIVQNPPTYKHSIDIPLRNINERFEDVLSSYQLIPPPEAEPPIGIPLAPGRRPLEAPEKSNEEKPNQTNEGAPALVNSTTPDEDLAKEYWDQIPEDKRVDKERNFFRWMQEDISRRFTIGYDLRRESDLKFFAAYKLFARSKGVEIGDLVPDPENPGYYRASIHPISTTTVNTANQTSLSETGPMPIITQATLSIT